MEDTDVGLMGLNGPGDHDLSRPKSIVGCLINWATQEPSTKAILKKRKKKVFILKWDTYMFCSFFCIEFLYCLNYML